MPGAHCSCYYGLIMYESRLWIQGCGFLVIFGDDVHGVRIIVELRGFLRSSFIFLSTQDCINLS